VNGRDRPGLLFDLTSSLTALKLQIGSAKVSTFGERVVDVFYVKDLFGLKIEKENRINEIRATLLNVLAEAPNEAAAVSRPRRVRRRLAA
jgi:[protein-PII] uridylyltransferase